MSEEKCPTCGHVTKEVYGKCAGCGEEISDQTVAFWDLTPWEHQRSSLAATLYFCSIGCLKRWAASQPE